MPRLCRLSAEPRHQSWKPTHSRRSSSTRATDDVGHCYRHPYLLHLKLLDLTWSTSLSMRAPMAIYPKKLQINTPYTRSKLGGIFGDERISGSREGLYPDGDHVIFFVTLDKGNSNPSVSYEDYFSDGLFHWENQSTQACRATNRLRIQRQSG